MELSQSLLHGSDLGSRSKMTDGLASSKASTYRKAPEIESTLRENDIQIDKKFPEKINDFSKSAYTPKTNKVEEFYSKNHIESKSDAKSFIESNDPFISQRNPLRITLSESKQKAQKQLINETKLKERSNKKGDADKSYALYIQTQKRIKNSQRYYFYNCFN